MPDLRQDPVTQRWVIIARDRANRPNQFRNESASATPTTADCPFCAGREDQTPPAVATYPAASGDGSTAWQVRVVPNLFPALAMDNQGPEFLGAAGGRSQTGSGVFFGHTSCQMDQSSAEKDSRPLPAVPLHCNGLFQSVAGVGAHEVIIESPQHVRSLTELDEQQRKLAFLAYRDRLRAHKLDPRLVCGIPFKNVGPAAGASLEHVHSQLLVLPLVPPELQQELEGAAQFYRQRSKCVFCEMIEQELAEGTRIVARTARFVAICPFASRFGHETWVLPLEHASHFEEVGDEPLYELSGLVREIVARIQRVEQRAAYNYLIHSAPFDISSSDHYHWHVEVLPRTTKIAGFELGTGFHINAVPPEEAAATLRSKTSSGWKNK